MLLELRFSIWTLGIGAGTFVAALYGMNLKNFLEESDFGFGGLSLLCAGASALVLAYGLTRLRRVQRLSMWGGRGAYCGPPGLPKTGNYQYNGGLPAPLWAATEGQAPPNMSPAAVAATIARAQADADRSRSSLWGLGFGAAGSAGRLVVDGQQARAAERQARQQAAAAAQRQAAAGKVPLHERLEQQLRAPVAEAEGDRDKSK
jgi:hypothetical protein